MPVRQTALIHPSTNLKIGVDVLTSSQTVPPKSPALTTLPDVYIAAARLIAVNGHHQGDYLPDPFDRTQRTPHPTRSLSIVAALRCAVTGDPHAESPLADRAVETMARRLLVNERGPAGPDRVSLEAHVAAWGNARGRRTESVVAVLYAAADSAQVIA